MTDLHDERDPLVPEEVDLRDFAFMPLDVVRLRDSDLGAVCSDAEIRAALWLWCAAWHQVPAGSIPDDDRVLALMAGFGRGDVALNQWLTVRDGALRGFVRCRDGRLYHVVIAEKAIEAWREKIEFRKRKEAFRQRQSDRARSRWDRHSQDTPPDDTQQCDTHDERNAARIAKSASDADIPMKGTGDRGQGQGTGINNSLFPSSPAATESASRKGSKRQQSPISYPAAFIETFWAVYPRPTHKIAALKSWERAVVLAGGGQEGISRISAAAASFAASVRGKDPRYVPHPATWLNAGAWDDPEPSVEQSRPAGYIPRGNE